ncbi:unnamed protein product, partial [Mesorhabditis belari]|uniref:Uncharacterized protein n=1 Tax=Mesorhabditis belari TaxID=2138241 RepID=A0AAF3E803_9BILA
MHSGIFYSWLLWACVVAESVADNEVRVLILGAPEFSVAKWDLIDAFFPTHDIQHLEDPRALFNTWGCELEGNSMSAILERPSNISCLAVSSLATDQMNLDEIGILFDFLQTVSGLAVVELGEATVQLRALLGKNAACWGIGTSDIVTPNRVYLCGKVHPNHLPALGIFNVQNIGENTEPVETEMTFWPCIFASAAKSEKKHKAPVEDDDEEEEKVDERASEEGEKKVRKESLSKKYRCKYRKSCYESGVLPEIRNEWQWGFSASSAAVADENNDDVEEGKDDMANIRYQKWKCKYRKSCYEAIGLQQEKKEEDEEKMSFFSGKISAPQGKKKTVKEIAEKTLQKVKEREDEAKDRELPNSVIVEKKLEAIEKEINKKVACKYRQSCYETGKLPRIDDSWPIPSFNFLLGSWESKEPKEDVNLDELSELERKFRCKYRKSCLETGVLPEIAASSFGSLDFGALLHGAGKTEKKEEQEVIDDPNQTLQHRCKYRLSCYETGILPDLNPQDPVAVKAETESTMPTSATALKHFCKYRKSCYEKIALSDGLSAIKEIRKERTVEPVVRSGRRRVLDEAALQRRQNRRQKLAARKEARLAKRALEGKSTGETPKQLREKLMAEKAKTEKEVQHKNRHYQQEKAYRKSCYASGKKPDLDRGYLDLLEDFNRHVEKQYETDLQKHLKEEDKKLACKYRKSCYETGRLVLVRDELPKPTIKPVETSLSKAFSIQHQCKYRKSCYAKHGLKVDDIEKDEVPAKKVEQEVEKQKVKIPAEKPKSSPPSSEAKKKDKKKKEEREEKEDDSDEESDREEKKGHEIHLSTHQKHKCKYRISCYGGVEPKAKKVEHKEPKKGQKPASPPTPKPQPGVKPREHCHQYWFSCREWMGLPPKEKAPIGPNGKRLCRKKKREE